MQFQALIMHDSKQKKHFRIDKEKIIKKTYNVLKIKYQFLPLDTRLYSLQRKYHNQKVYGAMAHLQGIWDLVVNVSASLDQGVNNFLPMW